MDPSDPLIASLPAVSRLALVYAPRNTHRQMLALFALDARLAGLIRGSSEPMLAQLRLAWWRESLGRPECDWPSGDPIFAALRSWNGQHSELAALVDGWEALTVPPPLGDDAMQAFADGRGAACAALAKAADRSTEVLAAHTLGRIWAIEDLATRLTREDERKKAFAIADELPLALPRTGRALRPLRVLAGLTRRRRRGGEEAAASPTAVLEALKLGLLGI